jgi:membrane dipeptidase
VPDPSRRGVLWGTVGAVLAPEATARAEAVKRASQPGAGGPMLTVNALGGLGDPNIGLGKGYTTIAGGPGMKVDVNDRAIKDAKASGVAAINITLGYVSGPDEPFEKTVGDIGLWDEAIRANPGDLMKVYSAADILKARAEKKVGLIYGFQNTPQIGERLERVDIFADLGVRVVQMTYNPAGGWGDGSMAPENRGLTPLGRRAIEKLNGRRIMVDLSHSGEKTCLEAAAASKQPISINHTGCRALTDLPRNKTDAELKLVADKGGFVGIYFMPFLAADSRARAQDVVAHIEHAVKVCGEDHVGIGTDGGLTAIDDMKAYDESLAKEHEARVKAGIAAKGEEPGVYPFVPDLTGPQQFRTVAAMLRKGGMSQVQVENILGRNFLRYARDVWGA